jgi:hypothetical protein
MTCFALVQRQILFLGDSLAISQFLHWSPSSETCRTLRSETRPADEVMIKLLELAAVKCKLLGIMLSSLLFYIIPALCAQLPMSIILSCTSSMNSLSAS